MNESRYAVKVGLFVAVGLVLLTVLLMSFSKGFSLFTPTYSLTIKASSVGGLKKNANVLLSGVPVGKVGGFDVAPDGKGVLIHLQIENRYQNRIYQNARFSVQQLGLLGDQYVEITPATEPAPVLQAGQTVQAEEPLSIQATARSAKDLIALATETLTNVNEILTRANHTILSEHAMTNAAAALENLGTVSARVAGMMDNVDRLVQTNSPGISQSVSNLVRFSKELDQLSAEMNQIVITNRGELTKAVKNLEATSRVLQNLATEVEAGKGAAGMLLKDEQFRQNLANVASNLEVFSQNLNSRGLLRSLFFKPKAPRPPAPTGRTNEVTRPVYPGNNPFSK